MVGRRRRIYLRVLRVIRKPFWYPRCLHLSHRLLLPCWRAQIWDSYCPHHNDTCWGRC
jgi:hypothetical protein